MKSAFQSEAAPLAWVHCASLGEFEQGRPIIERFKDEFPSYKILLTFFSPSGYEVRKNYALADYIFYLPWDTPDNARKFVELTKPQIAFFVKYEFWHNYIKTLEAHRIPILSVSSIFRPDQIFFKSYGGFFRRILERFNHFFVQNEKSEELLNKIGISNTSTAGDTRFDRVDQIVSQSKEIEIAQKFKNGENVFVVGSCWPEDLEVLAPHINSNAGKLKFIIAPHELKESFLVEIENALSVETVRYSEVDTNVDSADVMIIDNVGMLSALYRYGEYAYVGGAFGKGLHNILEAACYGVPIFFGNKNYLKFREAQDLIVRGGAFEVSDYADFKTKYESLINRPENYLLACEVTKEYVAENLGATKKILDHCHKLLDSK
ncbi:MAG: glycosyltransferase N-terminal domain-containing protein [Cyclobacteriaceae bacterium]